MSFRMTVSGNEEDVRRLKGLLESRSEVSDVESAPSQPPSDWAILVRCRGVLGHDLLFFSGGPHDVTEVPDVNGELESICREAGCDLLSWSPGLA